MLERLSTEEYLATYHGIKPKRSKYRAIKTVIDGITFASKKEAKEYLKLKQQEQLGYIYDLKLQPEWKFEGVLNSRGIPYKYKADFSYKTTLDNEFHVVDVKGMKTNVYGLKKALMKYFHNISVREV